MEIRSIYQYTEGPFNPASGSGRLTVSWAYSSCGAPSSNCYVQLAFKGSIFNDNLTPTFTYPGRQEMYNCLYTTIDSLSSKLKSELQNGWKFVFWNSAYNTVAAGCQSHSGNTISIKTVVDKLKQEFPSQIFIVPDGTSTTNYLSGSNLKISNVSAILNSNYDNPATKESGVVVQFKLEGSGVGNIQIKWGNQGTELISTLDLQIGNNSRAFSLVRGTHKICVTVV